MIYMLSLPQRRRVHRDRFVLTGIGRRNARSIYGKLRDKGFDEWEARGIVLDLVIAGSFCKFHSDVTEVAS